MNGGHGNDGRATGGCCDANPNQKPRSHDTSRIAWAKLMARVGAEFPLQCPSCGGDIRLIAFITEPGPIRKILTGTASGLMSTMRNMPASSHARWTWIFAPWPDEPMRRYMNMTNSRADLCE